MSAKRVVAAMSGGVDSSVAAAIMVEQGWDTVGVTLKLLPRGETGFGCCGSPADIEDAARVCAQLGIPHYSIDLASLFEDQVIAPFVRSYLEGRTPNPCAECNRSLKFGYLPALAEAWGADRVATGHYARVEAGKLFRSVDEDKDQTYFLYALTARELARAKFPVGNMTKEQVREKARELGLATADKKESQELCFIPNKDYKGFLASRPEGWGQTDRTGPIKDGSGRELGRHNGLAAFTVGQRKGLGLAGGSAPRYVVRLENDSNTVVVGGEDETLSAGLLASGVSWTGAPPEAAFPAQVRVRHRHPPAPARVEPLPGGRARVVFEEPQRAVAPGQAAVFYRGREVMGGGTIFRQEAL